MSKVISFRFDADNKREAKALAVLQRWLARGFSTRHTITEALLMLDSSNSQAEEYQVVSDLSQQIKILLDNIEKVSSPFIGNGNATSKDKLNEGFVTTIIQTVKPGIKFG